MKQKPHYLLLYTALVLLLTSLFIFNKNYALDIHLHDTYFVIAHTHILWLLAIIALFIWALYLPVNKFLYSNRLTWLHVITSNLALLLIAGALLFGNSFINPAPLRYYDYSNWNALDQYNGFAKAVGVIVFVLLFAQIIFIGNFIGGLVKRMRSRKA